MKLFKKNKYKKQNSKKQNLYSKNENFTPQNKSKEEIYREKKQELKRWLTTYGNEKQMYESQLLKHNEYVNSVNGELEHIQQQMQTVHKNTKKNMLIFLVFLVAWICLVGIAMIKIYDFHSKELEEYQQQLDTEMSEYTSEIEIQKQDLQQQIETLTQKLDSLE